METLGADPRTDDDCCEQFGVSCTETLSADSRTDDELGQFGVSLRETLGADQRTDDDCCEQLGVSCTETLGAVPRTEMRALSVWFSIINSCCEGSLG